MRFGTASAALGATDQVKNEIGGAARSSGRMHRGPRAGEMDKEERTPPHSAVSIAVSATKGRRNCLAECSL